MTKKRVRHHVNPLSDLTEHTFSGFKNDKPIIIDIGADHGEFTEGLLKFFNEERNFIVFEIRKPLAEKLRQKFKNYLNVVVFDGNANRNFENIVKPCLEKNELAEIYINFPDPWFKDRHKKRRVLNEKFLLEIKSWMPKTTKWIFQTDQKPLFQETLEMLKNFGITEIDFFSQSPHNVTTKWEQAKINENLPIFRMSFYF